MGVGGIGPMNFNNKKNPVKVNYEIKHKPDDLVIEEKVTNEVYEAKTRKRLR